MQFERRNLNLIKDSTSLVLVTGTLHPGRWAGKVGNVERRKRFVLSMETV